MPDAYDDALGPMNAEERSLEKVTAFITRTHAAFAGRGDARSDRPPRTSSSTGAP